MTARFLFIADADHIRPTLYVSRPGWHVLQSRRTALQFDVRRLLLLTVLGAVAVLPSGLQAQRGFAARASVRLAPRMAAPPARMMPVPRGIPAGGIRLGPPGRLGHPFFVNTRFRHHHHFFFTSGCFGNPFLCSGSYYPYSLLSYPPTG